MSKPCEKKDTPQGLEVISRSGNGSQTICNLGHGTNVKHIVTIRNKRTYRLDIICEGLISAQPSRVEFMSPNPSDTSTHWQATATLFDGEERTFDHVSLVGISQGLENVHTYVEATWKEKNTIIMSTTVVHGIQVKVL